MNIQKYLKKQNDQREDYYKKIKERTNIFAKTTVNVGEDQKILVNYEESKYQKEKEEINNKLNAIDKENHMKKNKMIEEMKRTLDMQIQEKRKKFDLEKEYNDRFNKESISKTVNEFSKELSDTKKKR